MCTPSDFYKLGAGTWLPESHPVVVDAAPAPPTPAAPALEYAALKRPALIWDTETSGLRPPVILQLAYVLIDATGERASYDELLRLPAGVKIDPRAHAVHGISAADLDRDGVEAAPELEKFHELCARVRREGGVVLGHNISFDCKAFDVTARAHGVELVLDAGDMLCTMHESKRHSPLTTKRGHVKNFKLCELYEHTHGGPPSWARLHSALDDVRVTAYCYVAGAKRGWW